MRDLLTEWTITLLLFPVLLAQGVYVRVVTPRLAEPAGDRSGTTGSGPALRLLILGDSAAAGVGVETQDQALAGRLRDLLGTDHQLHWKLLAQSGHTLEDLLARLAEEPAQPVDVVLVSIGVNDVTGRTALRRWEAGLESLAQVLRSRFGDPHVIFSALPPMHLFPALPQPLRWWLGAKAVSLTARMGEVVARLDRCEVLPALSTSIDLRMVAEDGFHPGAPAYLHWAETAAQRIRQRHRAR